MQKKEMQEFMQKLLDMELHAMLTTLLLHRQAGLEEQKLSNWQLKIVLSTLKKLIISMLMEQAHQLMTKMKLLQLNLFLETDPTSFL